MSIINDALKKTQEKMVTPAAPAKPRPEPEGPQLGDHRFGRPPESASRPAPNPVPVAPSPIPSGEDATPSAQKSRRPLWIGGLLVIILLLLGGGVVLLKTTPVRVPGHPRDTGPSQSTNPGGLVLEGIMTTGAKKVALINNEIYETGDTVNGIKIVEITADHILISSGGAISALSVHRR